MPKLTKPQRVLLEGIAKAPMAATSTYPPVLKLLGMGLIEERKGKWSDWYDITEAGRAALATPPA